MPASNVQWFAPLIRMNPWHPGQMGVPGTDSDRGLRLDTAGKILWVDPNHPDANDQRDGTNPEHPLRTVAAALLQCRPFRGDVIAVMSNNSWQYGNPLQGNALPISENVIITVPGVRLIGISQSSSTGVLWTPASNGGTCITVNALDVSIEGFLFTEGSFAGCDAIVAVWNGALGLYGDNLTVRNCVFDDTVDVAIAIDYVWYANIHHNVFWDCDDAGIQVFGANGAAFLLVSDNNFHDCANHAMDLANTDDSHIFNNSIFNTKASTLPIPLACTDEGITTAGGARNQVYNNSFSCLLPFGVGDWDDLNTSSGTDAWIGNHCMNGLAITNPT